MNSFLRSHWLLSLILLFACGKSEKKEVKQEAAKEARAVVVKQGAKRDRFVLRQVLVREISVEPGWEIDTENLATQLGAKLLDTDALVSTLGEVSSEERSVRVELHVGLRSKVDLPTETEEGRIAVALESVVFLLDGGEGLDPQSAILVEVPLQSPGKADVNQLLNAVVSDAVRRTSESLSAQSKMLRADDQGVLKGLAAEDPAIRLWAMRIVARRGLDAAVAPLLALLKEPDPELSGQAITSLVAIGSKDAVAGLADLADFKDYEQLAMVMEAVSAIGGPDAVEFLEFVASGHSSPELRERAKQSIKRLQDHSRDTP